MNETKFKNLLGMAQRAGKLLSGDFVAEKAIKRGNVPLALLATDCAKNNAEKYIWLAQQYDVPLRNVLDKSGTGSCHRQRQELLYL